MTNRTYRSYGLNSLNSCQRQLQQQNFFDPPIERFDLAVFAEAV